jgi:Fe-S-cluster-containing hydrogenase component 2
MKIIIDVEACYGCRTCELACSYHHAKIFSPELSSVKVQRNNRTGKIVYAIDSTCDFCKGEMEPLCAKYCFYGGIKFEK